MEQGTLDTRFRFGCRSGWAGFAAQPRGAAPGAGVFCRRGGPRDVVGNRGRRLGIRRNGRKCRRQGRRRPVTPRLTAVETQPLTHYIVQAGLRGATESNIPGALSILKGAVPDLAPGLGRTAPTYVVGSRDRALRRPLRPRTFFSRRQDG